MFSGRLWELFIDSFPKILIPGLTVTIPLTVISFTFALIIAVIMALVQFANVKVLKQIARFYIWIFRGTPLLVQLFVVFFGLSRIGILLDPFPAAVIVFSLNEGAYCAETIRAALESVPKGQLEAGQCVLVRRDNREKTIVKLDELETKIPELLQAVHDGLYERALKNRQNRTFTATTFEEMKRLASEESGFIETMWCGDLECEMKVKEEAGLTSRCMPDEQKHIGDVCPICGKPAKHSIIWGKAY